jgi:hypothetical protein
MQPPDPRLVRMAVTGRYEDPPGGYKLHRTENGGRWEYIPPGVNVPEVQADCMKEEQSAHRHT